jgi:hypothetical protein
MNLRRCIVVSLAIAGGFGRAFAGDQDPSFPIGWIGDQPVTHAEWLESLRHHLPAHADEAQARIAAHEALVRERALWALAAEAGLETVSNEGDLRARHVADTEARRIRMESGQPLYGPRQLSWPAFRRHWTASLRHALLRALSSQQAPDLEEVRAFYLRNTALFTDAEGRLLPLEDYRDHVIRTLLEERLDARVAGWIDRTPVRWSLPDEPVPKKEDASE